MVSAGMPELTKEEDINYFKNMLNLDYDKEHAEEHISKQISLSLKDKTRLADNYIHEKAHAQKKINIFLQIYVIYICLDARIF